MALPARSPAATDLHPIRDVRSHALALDEIHRLWSSARPADLERVELLSILVEAYEREHVPMPAPSPLQAISFRMEQLGLSLADLARILGSRSRATEVLNGRRELSLNMVRRLHVALSIPAETLIQPISPVPSESAPPDAGTPSRAKRSRKATGRQGGRGRGPTRFGRAFDAFRGRGRGGGRVPSAEVCERPSTGRLSANDR